MGLTLISVVPLFAQIVINEIHYDPDLKTEPVEFIELHNTGPTAVDLSGWEFAAGISYSFDAGTTIAPDEFLVVTQNPAALHAKFGVSALGPWNGKLDNDGERIELQNAAGESIDRVTYRRGFPWPTVGDSPGYSIELVHPAFDNDLGGNWRASFVGDPVSPQGIVLVASGSTWRYFKGTSEPSDPRNAWRQVEFNDVAWLTGPAPVGYGESFIATPLADMRGNYSSVYLRHEFVVDDPSAYGALVLDAQYDDGFKAWINGITVIDGQANMPTGEVAYNATASSAIEEHSFVTFNLAVQGAAVLRPGVNVLAIQAHNANLGVSSDFFLDARLVARPAGSTGNGPTPGRRNSVYAINLGPQIRQVQHSPQQPTGGQPVAVTAKITDPEGVTSVSVDYQLVDPGAYIELTESAYTNNWTTVTMNDTGVGGDELPGDGVYTVTLPGHIQSHRRLVRYRIRATDGAGMGVQVPYPDDPQPNFAYYVYDGVPGWRGSIRPGVEPVLEFTAEEMGRLPVIQLLSKQSAVEDCTWFRRYGGDQYLWRGTLVYDGQVYDHIQYRARGGVWRYAMTKNMWKFRLNRGHEFQAHDKWGRPLNEKWTRLNLGASIQQGDYLHRGEQGMFESVGFRLFDLAGVEAPHTAFATLRIVTAQAEAHPTDQFTGDFWGVYLVTEQIDGRFLDEHGLPDGNLYKMENGTGPSGANGELKNQGPDQVTDTSDLIAFRSAAEGPNNRTDDWWRQNLDLPRYYSYQTILQAIHHYDVCCGKNYYYFNNPDSGRWIVLPWDLDLSWSDNMYVGGVSGGTEPFRSRVLSDFSNNPSRPDLTHEFRNRVREIRDLLYNTDQTWQLIDEYAGLLRGPSPGPTLLDADRAMWDYNPKMISSTYSTSPGSKAGHGRFYQSGTPTKNFAGMVQKMKNYVDYRSRVATLSPAGAGLDALARDTQIPATPSVVPADSLGFPVNRLTFRASPYSGTHAFAYRQWRIAEVTPPGATSYDPDQPRRYEIEADWESGAIPAPDPLEITFPSDVVRVGATYRVRSRVVDVTGRASHWSATVEFTAAAPDNEPALVEHLRLTELMFQPPEGSDWEYLELHNRSPDLTLDLDGARFADGIDYTFAPGTLLPPGGYLLLVAAPDIDNFAAFRTLHGLPPTVPVVGPYSGRLDNAGEELTLRAGRAGPAIFSFHYHRGRGWPLAARGTGHSLVPLERAMADQSSGALDYAGNWRPSAYLGGSPGQADPTPPTPPLLLNEIVAHTDYFDPTQPEIESNDWIELFNPGTEPVALAGWFLSDTPDQLRRWALPNVTLPPRGFLSFDQVSGFDHPPGSGFGLDKDGEQVLLSYLPGTHADRVVDSIRFEGQENERSLGRYPDGGADWYALERTREQPNHEPELDAVLSEIMYRPPSLPDGTDNLRDPYLELHNPTASTMDLFTSEGAWRVAGGISFTFPASVSLQPHETILILSFDPVADPAALVAFRETYGLAPSAVRTFGPFDGSLRNRGEDIRLERPQAPDELGAPYSWVIVDEVIYGNQDPWPANANGAGLALHRLLLDRSGHNPANWFAAQPGPGVITLVSGDTDGDGLPDDWEMAHGLDPSNPTDALLDLDDDGMINLHEFLAGTDPRDPGSRLAVQWSLQPNGNVALRFIAFPDRSYTVQYQDGAFPGTWMMLQDVPATPESRLIEWIDPAQPDPGPRLYRVVTPSVPQ